MKEIENGNIFLFSVDVEDPRIGVKNGDRYADRVAINTNILLNWLDQNDSKCTFFITGQVGEKYPTLITEIIQKGHEVACHTTNHLPLNRFTPDQFFKDLVNNISVLKRAGAIRIDGFRAPSYSLTQETEWVYPILKELGFIYSSSVLPAKNPLYGWPEFGQKPKLTNSGILEIPITVKRLVSITIPTFGGIYLRVLPKIVLSNMIKRSESDEFPLVGYIHPYDIDSKQERFMHAGINNNQFYHWLMYYNRKSVLGKLDSLLSKGFKILPYINYVEKFKGSTNGL